MERGVEYARMEKAIVVCARNGWAVGGVFIFARVNQPHRLFGGEARRVSVEARAHGQRIRAWETG